MKSTQYHVPEPIYGPIAECAQSRLSKPERNPSTARNPWNHGIERNLQGILALTSSHALCRKG
jgi:hypothetical protein